MNKTTYTNHSDPEQNAHYPALVSDRSSELIEQLDSEQILKLYNELQTKTYVDWMGWFEDGRAKIEQYDGLNYAERQDLLDNQHGIEPLILHHACVFLELWHARTESQYYTVRKNDHLIQSDHQQRTLLLCVLVSYDNAPNIDLWPFDHDQIETMLPFRE